MAYNNSTSTYSQYPNPSIFPAPVLPLDLALLTALCKIQGKSGDEGDMQQFILDYLAAQGLAPKSDGNGNITCTKGEADAYPCLVAHMDTVHSRYSGYDVGLSTDGQVLYAYANTAAKVNEELPMLSVPSYRTQVGVGGDDRCGLYVALHLLTELPACKVAFFVEEEIGMGKGSRFVDMTFFDDAAIVLQCDRKGHDDWVQNVSGTKVSGDDFIDSIRDLLLHHKYTVTQNGGPTDVGALKSRGLGVVAANMSCGYYNPHSSTETIFLPALENTLNLCLSVLERVGYVKQLHAHAPYVRQESYNEHRMLHRRYDERRSYGGNRLPAQDPFGAGFSAMERGWTWVSADEMDCKHGVKGLKIGGLTKLVNNKLMGPYTLGQVKDYEREADENAALVQATVQTKLLKEAKAALIAWIAADGTWEHNQQKGSKSQWVKWLTDGGTEDLLYPVAYAKARREIPGVEHEFQQDWAGCYGPDASSDIAFTAQTISKFIHEQMEQQATKLAEKEARSIANQHQLPFDDGSETYSVTNIGEEDGVSYRVTRKYINGQLVSTTTESAADAIDDNALVCPECKAACTPSAPDSMDGAYFYCEACKSWNQEEDMADGNDDDDAYSRYLSKHQGQWRDSRQEDYERAYKEQWD